VSSVKQLTSTVFASYSACPVNAFVAVIKRAGGSYLRPEISVVKDFR